MNPVTLYLHQRDNKRKNGSIVNAMTFNLARYEYVNIQLLPYNEEFGF